MIRPRIVRRPVRTSRIRLVLGRPGYVGRDSELGNRLFVEAVIWKFRTGVLYKRYAGRVSAPGRTFTRDSRSRWADCGDLGEFFSKPLADDPDN